MGFVVLWATGFAVARLVAPHTEPLTFLAVRFALSAACFAGLAAAAGAPWPRTWPAWRNQLVAGVMLQGVYLGGVFWSVRHGLPAGLSALVTGLQPLLTAMLSFWLLGERVRPLRWAGIIIGFAGALLVLAPQLHGSGGAGWPPLAAVGCSMLGITLGTIWQKRTGSAADLRTTGAVQFAAAAIAMAVSAALLEHGRIDGSWPLLFGLAWGVLVLSLGAVPLMLLLIRRGAVAGVASLMYLVPPVAAFIAWLAFDEALAWIQVAGMLVAASGVWIASRD